MIVTLLFGADFRLSSMESNNVSTEASLSTKFKVWWSSLPLMYRSLAALMVSIYLIGLLIVPLPIMELCTWPAGGLRRFYTWIISAFVHNNLTHMLMNMMSFYAIGPAYERKVGSLALLVQSIFFAFYIGAVQYALASTLDPLLFRLGTGMQIPQLSNSCGIGYSGVLFAFWGIRSYEPGAVTTTETVFFFQTSSKVAPWLSLIVIQFLVPNASFFGHVLGLILGILHAQGWISFVFPHGSTICSLESFSVFDRMKSSQGYVLAPAMIGSARNILTILSGLRTPTSNMFTSGGQQLGGSSSSSSAPTVAAVATTDVV